MQGGHSGARASAEPCQRSPVNAALSSAHGYTALGTQHCGVGCGCEWLRHGPLTAAYSGTTPAHSAALPLIVNWRLERFQQLTPRSLCTQPSVSCPRTDPFETVGRKGRHRWRKRVCRRVQFTGAAPAALRTARPAIYSSGGGGGLYSAVGGGLYRWWGVALWIKAFDCLLF